MINFEDGKLVKEAYVVINGIEYPVYMPEYSGNVPLSSENMNKMQKDLLQTVFPVGSTYITQKNTNPNAILGFGTWERLKGRVCVGLDENDTDFNQIGQTGGEKTHTLTINEIPSHSHSLSNIYYGIVPGGGSQEFGSGASRSIKITMNNTGGDQPHNNLQPYEIVGYMWIRRS